MSDYYTIFTNIGLAKMANALALGQAVVLTHFAVGDGGNDGAYNPTATQAALINETYRAPINASNVDENNPSWLIVEAVIPANQGGWYVREAGIFDQDGDMIAVIRYPETFKPVLSAGVGKDLYLRVILEHSNTEIVELKIDPAIVLATRKYVDDSVIDHNHDEYAHAGMMTVHNSDADAHPDFMRRSRSDTVVAGFWTTPVEATLNDGTASFDTTQSNRFYRTVTQNLHIAAPDQLPAGGPMRFKLKMGVADLGVSWDSAFKINNGQISTEANAINLIHMEFDAADGVIDVNIMQRAES